MNLNRRRAVRACNFYRRDRPTVGACGDEHTICSRRSDPVYPGVGRPCLRFCHSDLSAAPHISGVTRRDDAGLGRPHTAGDHTRAARSVRSCYCRYRRRATNPHKRRRRDSTIVADARYLPCRGRCTYKSVLSPRWFCDILGDRTHCRNPLLGIRRSIVSGAPFSLTIYSAFIVLPHRMKLVHWPLMGVLLHLVQRGGDWAEPQPA